VFTSPQGKPVNRSNLYRRVLKPAKDAAGLEWVGFHTFRHTAASLLFEAGKNPKQVQEWLGHHSPAFTLAVYCHLLDGGLGDAEFLDEAVSVKAEPQEQGSDLASGLASAG